MTDAIVALIEGAQDPAQWHDRPAGTSEGRACR